MRFSKAIYAFVCLVIVILTFNPQGFATKYYSYQSGNWTGTNVWTTDSTGTTLIGSVTPSSNDFVCILTGRTIFATANIATLNHTITINIGAVLEMGSWSITPITLNGKGRIRTSRVSSGVALLPAIIGGNFLSLTGGTVEYYPASGSFYIDDNVASYCNLIINLGSVSQVMTIRRNLSIYGSLTVQRGTLQINDATNAKRTITVDGNLTVDANATITTGAGNSNVSPTYTINPSSGLPPIGQFHAIFHQLVVKGDFTNNGTIRFTNLSTPNYGEFANNGAVTVRFIGEAHNTVTLNGVTDFYNLIVDKGSDQTYMLTIYSTAAANFSLYGSNAVKRNQTTPFTQDNPEVRKALWIKNGTLKLTGNLQIPTLAEGPVGPSDQNGDYAIGLSAQLWIAGPDVIVYNTATNNSGWPQAPAGSVGVGGTSTAEQALSIFGTFRISDGYFNTRHSAGIIFWNTTNSSSMVIVEGGVLNASVMRSTWTASGKTSYVQTGGTVIVRGNETEAGELSSVPIFNIPHPSSTFIMTGGEIIIRDKCNGTGPEGNGIYINCDPGNFSVTGGKIIFETNPVNTPSIDVYCRVNIWNLEVRRLGSSGNATVNLINDLRVTNTINIYANATLSAGSGNFPVTISNDFFINAGGTYAPNNNTTTFTGYGNYFLWNYGTITNGLYNLQVNKPLGSCILASSAGSFTIRNNLMITNGILADGGKSVNVLGNVINSGTHIGAGKIALIKSTGVQTISGNGSGVFQNIEINNTTGTAGTAQVSLAADIGITGVLTLANDRLFNIAQYQVTLTALASIEGNMSNSRFILTSGAPSDGGINRMYADTTSYMFPVGSGTMYSPVTVHLNKKPTVFGSVSVRPVPLKHPFVSNTNCLPYYWKVEESGFAAIQSNSISMSFNYGTLPDNPLYVPGKYNPAFWTYLNDVALVNEASNMIFFPYENSFTGDYTAGIPDCFGAVTAFYSRANGQWSSPSTWSNQGYGGVAALTVPGPDNPVFIGNGSTFNHTVTVSSGSVFSGSLSIKQGSVLDIGATTGHNFGTVIPASLGKLRLTSTGTTAVFPAGDFGNFLGAYGGTVEYYTGTVNYSLPLISSAPTSRPIMNYYNLMLSPISGYTITMPDIDLIIYGTMTVNGNTSTALVRLNGSSPRSLTIKGNLVVNGGNLVMQHGNPQSFGVDGNLTVFAGAIFNMATTGSVVNHSLSLGGDVTNNGVFDLSNLVASNLYRCNVTFTGSQPATISGRGTTTDFYSITLDKGTNATPVLNIVSTTFTFSNNVAPLTLVNGTFRLSTIALSVTVASQKFIIPSSTCLSANGGFLVAASAADDDADVILAGMIEVKSGGIYIGNVADSINNDIEYSGAGYPTIEVSGGLLYVNGQVRRSMINGLGSLVYKQSGSGSVVTIGGRKSQPTRAKLEVLNPGSTFNMSGGTLNIVRGGSTTYNDLYLRPEKSTVTGGNIVFGSAVTEGTANMNNLTIDTQVPLFNLTVDGTTRSKSLTLSVHGITLKGTLTIQATSVFNADSLDVNIAGSLVNLNTAAGTGVSAGGYRVGSLRQVTTFNGTGTTQNITGTSGNITNFAKLVIINTNQAGTVALQTNSAVRVNSDLTLTSGTLQDGGNTITVLGNISNSTTHEGTGRILLAGTTVQELSGSGTGKFGNLTLNTTKDVSMITSMEITGDLTFQGKILDIGNNLLILSSTSAGSIVGYSATSYIRSNGLASDAGVRKSYPASPLDFTFPVGCPLKYTPARINVTSNNAIGTITVAPVNSKHYCTTNTAEYQLKYYWQVISTGFSDLIVTHYYNYLASDVLGNENQYYGGRFFEGAWTQGPLVNRPLHQINFFNVGYIDGDYTAGYLSEFQILPTYYSRNATGGGDWNTLTTWSTVSHSGPAATAFPNGQIVIIASGHTVTANGTGRRAYTLTLNGTALLDLGNTVGHDLGVVTGTGTIRLTPSAFGYYVFPAGSYNIFTSTGGGAIELSNPSGTAVFPYLQTYNRLILTGNGIKQMADNDILVNGSLTNETGSVFTASTVGKLVLKGDWINQGTFNHNNGTTIFNGTTLLSGTNPPILYTGIIDLECTLTGPLSGTFGFAGDWINNGTFNHNSGTVSFNGNTTLSGISTTTFNSLRINTGMTFTGKSGADFIVLSNWINNGNFIHNGGNVVFDGVTVISGSETSRFGGITINPDRYLTGPAADTLNVALNFTNNGYFNNNGGTISFNGGVQIIGGSASTLFENMIVETGSNTSVSAQNQTLRGVVLCHGTLGANNNLMLLSDQTRTALVDGSGDGEITGNLVMQRYLPVGFGYKYFSSAFHAANVGQFSPYMDPNPAYPTFPAFYKYDENRFYTGWLNYTNTSGILNPMEGYAINFGPLSDPKTVVMYGIVNNRNMIPVTLFNRNRPFTVGFNLLGNPYPSPIDWDATSGWIKTNIDNALYYFDAGTTDPYTGTYSTYVNGISSNGIASGIIPAMQGFFIHVSDGDYPVASTLIFTNGIRVNNLSPYFHKKEVHTATPLLRISARNGVEGSSGDPMAIYFNHDASMMFDKQYDALKLMNTDILEPNLYALSGDSSRLSVCSMPYPTDSITEVALGLNTMHDGFVIFRICNLDCMPSHLYIYFCDRETGVKQNIALHPEYRIYMKPGTYDKRFSVIFSFKDLRYQPGIDEPLFVYTSRNRLYVHSKVDYGKKADLTIYNLIGQRLLRKTITADGYQEIDLNYPTGIYIVSLSMGDAVLNKKVFINNQW
ncbi:MAG: T9SS type A sorting domain-containing protein [Bacteroidales bacterium]|nr:T9SS type A sorting domain-containing protein [Bacteroidales bacterium]